MNLRRVKNLTAGLLFSAVVTSGLATIATAQDCTAVSGEVSAEGCFECESSCSTKLDVADLFNKFAGDESIFDGLKNQKIGGMTYSVGGELRHRYMNEENRLRPTGGNAEYSLWRFTPHMKLQINDRLGAFVEGIDASEYTEGNVPYTPVPIDVNRMDFLRYYGEVALLNEKDDSLKYRYGRQFLNYGSQRLLSPLAWSNTFRNFEGHKLVYSGTNWDADAFMMKSVNGAAGGSGFGVSSLDSADNDRTISGVYTTYKGLEQSKLDLYWLYFDEDNALANRQDGSRHTLGARFAGTQALKECDKLVGTWAWDLEAAYQFGRDNFIGPMAASGTRDVSAGMAAATLGYTFNEVTWSPGLKTFYYWSSGTEAGSTDNNTFCTLYPLGHAYWGQIDNFSGQNLHDAGAAFSLKPHSKLNVEASCHYFAKAEKSDYTYNIVGAPLGGTTGNGDIGQELDLVATIPVTTNFNVQTGYFWFFYGDEFANRKNAQQFYLQTTWKF